MSTFIQLLTELSATEVTLLLLGEAGVGKHLVARRIHDSAPWRHSPFVECDCRELNDQSLKKAFESATGADLPYSLYLHRIEALSTSGQRTLLACMDAKEGRRRWPRLIASASSDFEMEMRTGRFREDLYYKLSRVCLPIPPLRYRQEDIVDLADALLKKYALEFNRPKPELSIPLTRFLHSHPWMGNLDELEEAMRTIVAVGNVRVAIAALRSTGSKNGREKKNGSEPVSLKQVARAASQRAEREVILKALSRTHWNRKKAAEELRISYKALLYKLKEISSPGLLLGPGGKGQ